MERFVEWSRSHPPARFIRVRGYPHRFDQIGIWAEQTGVSLVEARRRFVQFAILSAIAGSRSLQSSLVFKGGNALDFVWQPNRSTLDLDFSIDHDHVAFVIEEDTIERLFSTAIQIISQRFGLQLAVHFVRQEPPGPNRTFATYVVRIGHALPDEVKLRIRMNQGRPSPNVIDVEISINEPICATSFTQLDELSPSLRVCTLEDIVAEKLRAILQQPIRNRMRRQDLLDIAVIMRLQPDIDLEKVSDFLTIKCHARNMVPSRSMFHNPEIYRRARVDYDGLRATTRVIFVPFDEAWQTLMSLITELNLPD